MKEEGGGAGTRDCHQVTSFTVCITHSKNELGSFVS